jgi:hypothetical protein
VVALVGLVVLKLTGTVGSFLNGFVTLIIYKKNLLLLGTVL